jgi:type II secretory pathway component PulF
MKFIYQARNKEGESKRGIVVAASEEKAEQLLAENGFIISSLEVQEENIISRLNPFGKSVGYKDLVLFSRQLSTLIGARVPILQSLRILESQSENKHLAAIIREMITSVENGESFSLALSKYPQVFGNLYISLVKSGEASGSVAQSLLYLADQLEKDYDLRSKVKSALTYPVFVLAALVGVGFLMFKFVLPKLTDVLKQQGGDLPTISVFLIRFTDFFESYWWLVMLVLILLIVGFRTYVHTVTGRQQWDALKIKLPVVGQIYRKIYLARFARNLATLTKAGIPIIQALQIISDIIGNAVYEAILVETIGKVTTGSQISDALQGHPEFPPIVTQMVKVGEQSAQLDEILAKLASFYEKEVDAQVGVLATLLEPVIMVILGAGVGLLIAGILLPIYNLASTVG